MEVCLNVSSGKHTEKRSYSSQSISKSNCLINVQKIFVSVQPFSPLVFPYDVAILMFYCFFFSDCDNIFFLETTVFFLFFFSVLEAFACFFQETFTFPVQFVNNYVLFGLQNVIFNYVNLILISIYENIILTFPLFFTLRSIYPTVMQFTNK